MRSRFRSVVGVVAMVAVSLGHEASAAPADSSVEYLLGAWAVSCREPIGASNPLVTYFQVPGSAKLYLLSYAIQDGAITPDVTEVQLDGPIAEGRLHATFRHGSGMVNIAVLDVSVRESYRVVESRRSDGHVNTTAGVSVATGKPTTRYERCGPSS